MAAAPAPITTNIVAPSASANVTASDKLPRRRRLSTKATHRQAAAHQLETLHAKATHPEDPKYPNVKRARRFAAKLATRFAFE